MITTPSERVFNEDDISLLRLMAKYQFVRYSDEPFRLKSGIFSHVYVFGREDLTDHPDLGRTAGRKICDFLQDRFLTPTTEMGQLCLIGIPTAGTALAASASLVSYGMLNNPFGYRVMREQKKQYGAHQTWVNGKPSLDRQEYMLIDNVATDGKSKLEASEKLAEDGYPARPPCLIFIDRQQGAVEKLQMAGFRVEVVLNLLDVTYAYGELGLWPKNTVRKVEEEIEQHRLLLTQSA